MLWSALPLAAPGQLPALVTPQRILLVEDNLVNRRLATMMLHRAGHAVDVATNGRDAVRLAGAARYDVILMDAQMPEMDRHEATREIRRGERTGQHVPIIALTARVLEGDREKCLAAGMDDYMTKPVGQTELIEAVARWARLQPEGSSDRRASAR